MKKTGFSFVGLALIGLFFIGCTSNTAPSDTAVQELKGLVQAEDSLFTVNAFTDGDTEHVYLNHNRRMDHAGPFLPWFIRRQVTSANRNIDIELVTSDSALITVTHQIAGTLYVGVNMDTTNRTIVDTVWRKPFDVTAVHKAIAVQRTRQGTGDYPPPMGGRHHGWRIVSMTPTLGTAAGSDLDLQSVEVRNVTTGESITIDDPLNTFINWGTLPELAYGDSVEVYATVMNADGSGTTVISRLNMGPFARMRFLRLNDAGISPDQTADDNIFSAGWNIRLIMGMRPAMFDVIDNDLLTNPDASYNAIFLHMPMLVRFQHHQGGMGGRMNGGTGGGR